MASPLALNDCRWAIKSAVLNVLALEPTQQELDAIAEFLQAGGQIQFVKDSAALDNTQTDFEQTSSTVKAEGCDAECTTERQHPTTHADSESVQAFVDDWFATHSVDRPTVARGDAPAESTKQEPCLRDDSIPQSHPGRASGFDGPIVGQAMTSDKSSTTASNALSTSQPKKSDLTPYKMSPEARKFWDDFTSWGRPTPGLTFETPTLTKRTPPVRRNDQFWWDDFTSRGRGTAGLTFENPAIRNRPLPVRRKDPKTPEPKRMLDPR